MIPENRFPRQQDAAGELEGFSVKQKIEKLKKFHSIRFSLTSVVALLILLSVFISSTLSYSRYTRDFQEQSSEPVSYTHLNFARSGGTPPPTFSFAPSLKAHTPVWRRYPDNPPGWKN